MSLSTSPKLLILDVDEMLIFGTEHQLEHPPDFQVFGYSIYKRPGVDEFLTFCFDRFRVAIWSSSSEDYVQAVAAHLIPAGHQLEFIWSRKQCTLSYDYDLRDHFWTKKLVKAKRKGYNLEQMIVVDDSPEKHIHNYGNLVKIKAFHGELDDDELLHLIRYLEHLDQSPNIRTVEKRWWRNSF